jgi:hypothetical protein
MTLTADACTAQWAICELLHALTAACEQIVVLYFTLGTVMQLSQRCWEFGEHGDSR